MLAARYNDDDDDDDDDIKSKIDDVQQISRCQLCDDKVEKINEIIKRCSQLEQYKYNSRHD